MKRLAILAATVAAFAAVPAAAADFSYRGTLTDPNTPLFFNFTATGASTVTLVSFSYAGGTQADGTLVGRGGFDPRLALFRADGTFIGEDDDGSSVVDPSTTNSYDVRFSAPLTAGNYIVALTAFPLTANGNRLDVNNFRPAFDSTGRLDGRSSQFAFDILGVDQASGPGAVPEPATWAMMIGGFGLIGTALRRRTGDTATA
ncbi:hypothetical protein GGR88_001792 [Sphingomonas jejuensis]|uniref:Ice-binding protein C-terminal domain-containing protein n=1 Tax=Sphingomonas jejuensis TaxID=904715 RepID=A0ABX0XLR7_9SPHN|nr:DVUA0089 family protein [Sphingomonas jejuensis]NJC34318.1 hypothetical protein [Sphingomonas jejuensis]